MELVLTILFVLWLISFIKFKRAYKEHKLLLVFYALRYENNTSQSFNDKLDALRHYGNALILTQQYSKAYDIYGEAMRLLETQPILMNSTLGNEIRKNYEFCRSPLPWIKQPMNYNSSWFHNFLLVRFGRGRYMGFSEDSLLEYESWKRALNGYR